jgi:hypothetical protein
MMRIQKNLSDGVRHFVAPITALLALALVRFPSKHAAIIILTSSPTADAQGIADRIAGRLFSGGR